MTQYINKTTCQVVTEAQIRAEYPNTSFPSPFVPPEDFAVVFPSPAPAYDPLTQSVREVAPVLTDKGHYEQAYEVVDLDADAIAANQAAKAERDFIAAKAQREQQVAQIKVTTQAGHTFDGDEVSQGRMARAIIALQGTGAPSVTWVLADNTPVEVTAAELTEALALAGAAQAAIWVSPYATPAA